jgi:putative transcriptional regulator
LLADAGEQLGITVQAVSAHARDMAVRGLLEAAEGSYRPTAKGRQELQEGVRGLRDAVGALASGLDVIQVTSAVAAAPIKAGDEVGLWMADGDLEARPDRSAPSRGRAIADARTGDEAIVTDLRGLVKLEPGRLRVVSLPAPAEGGIRRVDRPRLLRELQKGGAWAKLGAHGTGARILGRALGKSGLSPPDFEFAADRASFNAAERGLDVLLLVSRDRLGECLQAFERLNAATLRRVPIEILEAPEQS